MDALLTPLSRKRFQHCVPHPNLMQIPPEQQSVSFDFFACGKVWQASTRKLRRKTLSDFDSGQASRALWSLRQRYASADASPRSDLRLHGWHLCFPNPEGPEWHIIRSCPPSDPGVVSQDTKEMRTGNSRFRRRPSGPCCCGSRLGRRWPDGLYSCGVSGLGGIYCLGAQIALGERFDQENLTAAGREAGWTEIIERLAAVILT